MNIREEIKNIIAVDVITAIEELDAQVGDIFCRVDNDTFECKVSRNFEDSSYEATTRINETVLLRYENHFRVIDHKSNIKVEHPGDKIEIYKSDLDAIRTLIIDSINLSSIIEDIKINNSNTKQEIQNLVLDLKEKIDTYSKDRDAVTNNKLLFSNEYSTEAVTVLSNLIVLAGYIIDRLDFILISLTEDTNAGCVN